MSYGLIYGLSLTRCWALAHARKMLFSPLELSLEESCWKWCSAVRRADLEHGCLPSVSSCLHRGSSHGPVIVKRILAAGAVNLPFPIYLADLRG